MGSVGEGTNQGCLSLLCPFSTNFTLAAYFVQPEVIDIIEDVGCVSGGFNVAVHSGVIG
jgi:hypothetical protein